MDEKKIFTVKNGIKFGVGFYIGRFLWLTFDDTVGAQALKVTEKTVAKLKEKYPEIFKD